MSSLSADDPRELLAYRLAALRTACFDYHQKHSKGAGGAAICICGESCGGSAACSMLRELQDFILYMPTKGLPVVWREKIEMMRSVL